MLNSSHAKASLPKIAEQVKVLKESASCPEVKEKMSVATACLAHVPILSTGVPESVAEAFKSENLLFLGGIIADINNSLDAGFFDVEALAAASRLFSEASNAFPHSKKVTDWVVQVAEWQRNNSREQSNARVNAAATTISAAGVATVDTATQLLVTVQDAVGCGITRGMLQKSPHVIELLL